jgi:MoxR-like ATPase
MNFPGALFEPGEGGEPGTGQYVYADSRIVLAVNVALATRRPLFVSGSPGSGKSTLAADVAARLGCSFAGITITSRTRQEDLVARTDSVRRLADAQDRNVKEDGAYLVPGVLWWAFDPDSAAALPCASDPRTDPQNAANGTVVLLDEIDMAEPDLPNDLLAPLDRFTIRVPGRPPVSAKTDVLIVITSNAERTMPPAFLRRCIDLDLSDDDPEFLARVAVAHFGERTGSLYADIAERVRQLSQLAAGDRRRRPSVAEYLDTVRACIEFGQRPPTETGNGTPLWAAIEAAALRKDAASRTNWATGDPNA